MDSVTLNYSGKERHVITTNIRVGRRQMVHGSDGQVDGCPDPCRFAGIRRNARETVCFAQAFGKRFGQLATVASGEWDKPGSTVTRTRTITKTTTTVAEPPKK